MASLDLQGFSLTDMLRCGLDVRRITKGAPSMEDAARVVVQYLYDRSLDPRTGERTLALVRCYKTHAFRDLEPGLQRFATALLQGAPSAPAMKCLTLLATAGDEEDWNSRHASQGHQCIPLPSVEMVRQAPMIAALIEQFGIDLAEAVRPAPSVIASTEGKSYGIFYVDNALDSPYIPAQEQFVRPKRIHSVIGFGGLLPAGDLYAVIMFSRVHIPRTSADRFRTIALDVKAALFPFREGTVFANDGTDWAAQAPLR